MVEIALRLVANYQGKQVDKGGCPYALHLIRIALKLDNEIQRTAALLHDIIEDTECTLEILKEKGISEDVIEIVDILTRKKDESYMDFIKRIKNSNNEDAIKIKKLDLIDNMNLDRLKEVKEEDIKRCKKYKKAYKLLSE